MAIESAQHSLTPSTDIQTNTQAPDDSSDGGGIGSFAAQEARQVLVATSSFVTTVVALLASAFGVVAALAWNKAISDWLQTVTIFNITDPIGKEFADAIIITLIAIVSVTALGIIAVRVRGKNLLVIQHPEQSTKDAKK